MEETIKNRFEVYFRISKISLSKCEINAPDSFEKDTQIKYTFTLQNSIDFENNSIGVTVIVAVHGATPEHNFANFSANITFDIQDPKSVVKILDDNTLEIHNHFLVTLNSISLSTMRGIIFSQLRGTSLEHFYMPIIDPKIFTQTELKKTA